MNCKLVQKNMNLKQTKIFCNILNVFTIIFYQFNASLLNKISLKKSLLSPNF